LTPESEARNDDIKMQISRLHCGVGDYRDARQIIYNFDKSSVRVSPPPPSNVPKKIRHASTKVNNNF
jgi:hypothetical protein